METTVLERIRHIISDMKISDKKFAEQIGMPQTSLSSLFSRGNEPNVAVVQGILNTFPTVSVNWLLFGVGDKYITNRGERIKRIREAKGFSKEEIAKELGVKGDYYARLESGEIPINRRYSERLSELTGYSVSEIGFDEDAEQIVLNEPVPDEVVKAAINIYQEHTKPRIPLTAAAGALSYEERGVTLKECEQMPIVNQFPSYDFTMFIKGDSMSPKYESGDEIACRWVNEKWFIQWGKVHVLDTTQGIIVKKVYEDGDKIRCVSINPDYPPFSIPKKEVYSVSIVVGLVRL